MTRNLLQETANMFRTFGFAVLRRFFEGRALAAEVDRVLADGVDHVCASNGARFRYVPMMTAETPASLSLLDRLEPIAAAVLNGTVLPTRAKAVRYEGNTGWHADSDMPVASVGLLAYLEPLRSRTGALRVVPGSHHAPFAEEIRAWLATGRRLAKRVACVIPTDPGDVVVMDEHVWHASFGGGARRQWRVDYLRVPQAAEMQTRTKAYFAHLYAPVDTVGYDAGRYPSYGPDWRDSKRPAVERLRSLGVYEIASAHEAQWARGRRSSIDRCDRP